MKLKTVDIGPPFFKQKQKVMIKDGGTKEKKETMGKENENRCFKTKEIASEKKFIKDCEFVYHLERFIWPSL